MPALLATALLAVAFCGHAQQRLERGHGDMGGGRANYGAYGHGGQAEHPAYRGYPGGREEGRYGGRYSPYPQQRFVPPPGYPAYGGEGLGRGPALGGQWRNQENFVRQGVRQGQLAPLGRVIQNIRRVTPGRQLDAGLEYLGPRLVYRVRWMTAQGRRVDYYVDAATGAILSGR